MNKGIQLLNPWTEYHILRSLSFWSWFGRFCPQMNCCGCGKGSIASIIIIIITFTCSQRLCCACTANDDMVRWSNQFTWPRTYRCTYLLNVLCVLINHQHSAAKSGLYEANRFWFDSMWFSVAKIDFDYIKLATPFEWPDHKVLREVVVVGRREKLVIMSFPSHE